MDTSGYVPYNANYVGGGQLSPIGGQVVSNYIFALERIVLGRLVGQSAINSGEFRITMAFTGVDNYWLGLRLHRDEKFRSRERVSDDLLGNLRSLLARALQSQSCKDFINEFVGGVDLLSVFDLVRVQGGFAFNSINAAGLAYGAVANEKPATSVGAAIDFSSSMYRRVRSSIGGTGTGLLDVELAAQMVGTLIHELIHASDHKRTDFHMRDRLHAAGKGITLPPDSPGDPAYLASVEWRTGLQSACGVSSVDLFGEPE